MFPSGPACKFTYRVQPVKAICCAERIQFPLKNRHVKGDCSRLFGTDPDWVEVVERTAPSGASVGQSYTTCLMTKLSYSRSSPTATTGQSPAVYAGCCGLTFMCCGCPSRPIRCFCFLCSVIWEEEEQTEVFTSARTLSSSEALRPLAPHAEHWARRLVTKAAE